MRDPKAETLIFTAQKTMYAGERIAKGDVIFIFASENEGGEGLIARGLVVAAEAVARGSTLRSSRLFPQSGPSAAPQKHLPTGKTVRHRNLISHSIAKLPTKSSGYRSGPRNICMLCFELGGEQSVAPLRFSWELPTEE
jgi:hypothetical protein